MTRVFRFKDVVKTYPGFRLGPLNFELEPGIVLGYIGPNGAGKTTTFHCLAGLVKADSGRMEIFGRQNRVDDTAWKLDIGYVGDEHVFYEAWNGDRNLRFLAQFYPGWSEDLAADFIKRFDLPLDKKVKHLSRGNRVKLSLVSALARSPRLLLLDEPTVGLDPIVRSEVLDVLFEALESGNRSIFYSTHILSDISRLADELAFISDGQIIQRSVKEDLTDRWRKISFRLPGDRFPAEGPVIESAVSLRSEGMFHQVISSDSDVTLRHLKGLEAENIQVNRMTIEEIAVQILKGGKNAETS